MSIRDEWGAHVRVSNLFYMIVYCATRKTNTILYHNNNISYVLLDKIYTNYKNNPITVLRLLLLIKPLFSQIFIAFFLNVL